MIKRLTLAVVFAMAFISQSWAAWWCSMCSTWHGGSGRSATNSLTLQLPSVDPASVLVSQPTAYTPDIVRDAMLAELQLTEEDVLYDLGCGDGRVLIAAYRQYGCRGVGIEIDPQTAAIAHRTVTRAGLGGRIRIVTGDATKFKYDGATAMTVYLFPEVLARLDSTIANVPRVASYNHEVPRRENRRVVVAGKYPIFVSESAAVADESWSMFSDSVAQQHAAQPKSVDSDWSMFDESAPQIEMATPSVSNDSWSMF